MKTLIAFLVLAAACAASDYSYRDGYYWRDGIAHSRYQTSYWSGCCWKYRYNYKPVKFEAAYQEKVRDAVSYNATEKLLEIAELKVKYDANLAKQQQEAKTIREGLQALGINAPSTASYGGYNQATIAGTTIYGQPSVAQTQQLYSQPINHDVHLQATERTAENMLKAVERLTAGNLEAVQHSVDAQSQVQKIQAIAELLKATPHVQTQWSAQLSNGETAQGNQATAQPVVGDIDALIEAKCASCHSANNPSGKSDIFPDGVDMKTWRQFGDEQWTAVLRSIDEKRMPKDADPLTFGEVREFLNARPLQ